MTIDAYTTRCTEKNYELAVALGWTFVPAEEFKSCTLEWRSASGQWQAYPRWANSNHQAFSLMLPFSCFPVRSPNCDAVAVETGLTTVRYAIEKVADHPDADAALRFAICNAVILKLKYDTALNDGTSATLEQALLMSNSAGDAYTQTPQLALDLIVDK